jgi:hypothetical protein
MKVSFEVQEGHIELWEQDDWQYAFIMGGRGNGRSGTASRYVTSRLLGKEYTRGAIMRAVREDSSPRFLAVGKSISRDTGRGVYPRRSTRRTHHPLRASASNYHMRNHGGDRRLSPHENAARANTGRN